MAARQRGAATAEARPLYLSLYDSLRSALGQGRWTIGASLPSEAALSREFGVSRITTRHALRLLESEGMIRKARARRPLVIATTPAERRGWMMESLADIVAMVADARLDIGSWRKERSAAEAVLFGLDPATPLHCLRGVLARAGRPYARSIILFPPAVGARLARADFDDTVVFRVLQRRLGIRIDDVELTIWAEPADADDAASLPCEPGAPILVQQLAYRQGGELVEVAYSRSLASEVRLSTHLTTGARG